MRLPGRRHISPCVRLPVHERFSKGGARDMNSPAPSAVPPDGWAPGYHSLRRIHRSRSSELYTAVRATGGMQAVLKVLLNPDTATEHITTLQTLNGNQGMLPLLDLGRTTSGQHFLVLPLYPAGSCGQVLGNSGPFSLAQAVAVGRSIGPALTAMHGHGLVHNAVAPENILAGSMSLLTGFGAVIRSGDSGIKVRGRESFFHAPPEALRGARLTPASDVYRLASTIWTLLIGRTPFASEGGEPLTDQAYAERVLAVNAPPVPRRDVSRVLSRVLTRGMAKDPEERYASAVDLATALERARTGTRTGPHAAFSAMRTDEPLTGVSGNAATDGPAHPPNSGRGNPADPPHTPWESAPIPREAARAPQDSAPGSAPAHRQSAPPSRVGTPAPRQSTPDDPYGPPPNEALRRQGNPGSRGEHAPTPSAAEAAPAVPDSVDQQVVESAPAQWASLVGWAGGMDTSLSENDSSAEDPPFDEDRAWDRLDQGPHWRKHLNIAVAAVSITAFSITTGIVAALEPTAPALASSESEEEAEAAEPEEETADVTVEPSPLPAVDPATEIALEDTLSAVTLTWADHTGGTGSYFVLGGPQGHDPVTLARTGAGAVTAQVPTDDTNAEYCFTVVAVDGGSAPADEVCTTRAADQAEAERLAEEEAAEEEEDEDEDEDDADPSPSPDADD